VSLLRFCFYCCLQDAGQPVSTAMMNIVCRAIGRLGNTEVTGKVFESYGAWGLQPDADSYNTVMESCEQARKVAAVEGLISYMSSKGVQPNRHSWNLLLSTAAAAQDPNAVASAVERMLASNVQLLKANASKALKVAHETHSESLLRLLRKANEQQQLGFYPRVFDRWWRRGGGNGSSGGNGHSSARADSWQHGMPMQQQRQQQQRQQQGRGEQIGKMLEQQGEQQGGSESEERKSMRAGLAAALGAAINE
jgi:pentatricopeptide repeat protein